MNTLYTCLALLLGTFFGLSQNSSTTVLETKMVKKSNQTYFVYHPNGELESKRTFTKQLNLTGDIDFYNDKGIIQSSAYYSNQYKTFAFYDDSGKLKSYGSINSNNQRIGKWVYFFNNGNLEKVVEYNNQGLPIFERSYYAKHNRIKTELHYTYQNGNSYARYLSYYSNGNIQTKGNMINNKPAGDWQQFNEYGYYVMSHNHDAKVVDPAKESIKKQEIKRDNKDLFKPNQAI